MRLLRCVPAISMIVDLAESLNGLGLDGSAGI
jgi:hypothetical protein